MSFRFTRAVALGAVMLAGIGLAVLPQPASARVHVGVGIGIPLFAPAYPAPAYYYPPVYYAPPPVYYAPPPPAYYSAAPAYAPSPTGSNCREYSSTTVIGGVPQPTYGTACQQPDGTWRIVN